MNNKNYIESVLPILLQKLVNNNPKSYHGLLKHRYKRIYRWIIENTPKLNIGKHTLGERVYWIIANLTDFPKCKRKECNKSLEGKFYNIVNGYHIFCSLSCVSNDEDVRKQALETSIARFGKDNINNRKQACQTMLDNYGVSCYFYANDFSEKSLSTIHLKYGNDIDNVFQAKEIKQQIEQTKDLKYNDPHYTNIEKQKETVINFSDEKKEDIKQKHIIFNQKNFGVDYTFQRDDVKIQIRQTNQKNYNADYPMQNPEFRRKTQKKYTFDNLTFSSKPEIAFYIWLRDNNIDFEYEPNIQFSYIVDGKTRYYHPDFLLKTSNQLVEIKGDQFFKEDGTMKNPFDQNQDIVYEAKHQCMLQHNVKILRSNEYSQYLEYVQKKYSKQFLDQLKNL